MTVRKLKHECIGVNEQKSFTVCVISKQVRGGPDGDRCVAAGIVDRIASHDGSPQ